MNFQSYLNYFREILDNPEPLAPYNKPDYFNYAKLNWSRMDRWLKHGVLLEETILAVTKISSPQYWIVITEPWCGDAAHIIPFFEKMIALNPMLHIEYELRDASPSRIDSYLTNGGKAIPKLIIKNEEGKDLAVWGPRPKTCQLLYAKMIEDKIDFETLKIALQKWYNNDAGVEIQKELIEILR